MKPSRRVIRCLVVEDDDDVREAIAAALRDEDYDVRAIGDGLSALGVVEVFRPDIVVLDVGLPSGLDGFAVARRIRAASDIPFVFVTASASVEDRLAGFEVGADDYVTKPFSIGELLARIRAVLRRSNRLAHPVWKVGDIVIDEASHVVVVADHPVELTAIEFALLTTLARNPQRVMSKVQLLTEVWGFDHYALNLVEVHISALRRKIEAHSPRVIHTVRSVGYVLRV